MTSKPEPLVCPAMSAPAEERLEQIEARLAEYVPGNLHANGVFEGWARRDFPWLIAQLRAALANNRRLTEALEKYGVHIDDCPRLWGGAKPEVVAKRVCLCGLDQARASEQKEKKG